MTEKQQAVCAIESDGTGVFVVFEGVSEASPARRRRPPALYRGFADALTEALAENAVGPARRSVLSR
jgi:hypothetical protein